MKNDCIHSVGESREYPHGFWGQPWEENTTAHYLYNKLFVRSDGVDMRKIPLVRHPVTGKMHFDHGMWPIG